MNSMRWMFMSATLILTVPACKKDSHATDNRAPATDPAAATSAEPAAPDTAQPAEPAGEAGKAMELYEDPADGKTAHLDKGADMVAVSSSGARCWAPSGCATDRPLSPSPPTGSVRSCSPP